MNDQEPSKTQKSKRRPRSPIRAPTGTSSAQQPRFGRSPIGLPAELSSPFLDYDDSFLFSDTGEDGSTSLIDRGLDEISICVRRSTEAAPDLRHRLSDVSETVTSPGDLRQRLRSSRESGEEQGNDDLSETVPVAAGCDGGDLRLRLSTVSETADLRQKLRWSRKSVPDLRQRLSRSDDFCPETKSDDLSTASAETETDNLRQRLTSKLTRKSLLELEADIRNKSLTKSERDKLQQRLNRLSNFVAETETRALETEIDDSCQSGAVRLVKSDPCNSVSGTEDLGLKLFTPGQLKNESYDSHDVRQRLNSADEFRADTACPSKIIVKVGQPSEEANNPNHRPTTFNESGPKLAEKPLLVIKVDETSIEENQEKQNHRSCRGLNADRTVLHVSECHDHHDTNLSFVSSDEDQLKEGSCRDKNDSLSYHRRRQESDGIERLLWEARVETMADRKKNLSRNRWKTGGRTQPRQNHGAIQGGINPMQRESSDRQNSPCFTGNDRDRPGRCKRQRASRERSKSPQRNQKSFSHQPKRQKLARGRSRRRSGENSQKNRMNHRSIKDPFMMFQQVTSGRPFDDWNPDDLCMFLAQNQNHLIRALMDPCSENREVTDKLMCLLRLALVEASALCNSSREQIMRMLRTCSFFESSTTINIVKSLVSTKRRNPDKSDADLVDSMLDVMRMMVDAHILSAEDTVFFLGSLEAALRHTTILVHGEDATLRLHDKAGVIENRVRQLRTVLNYSDHDDMDLDDNTDDHLGPILPDVRDIRKNRTNLQPRNVLDTFSSATEYIRYMFLSFREDFVGPLCKGIRDYIEYAASTRGTVNNRKPKFWNQDVRLYENVHVLDTALSNDTDVDVTIRIDSLRIRNFNSRLIYGSLVCLSCDGFRSVVYATVSDRELERLQYQGILNIHVLNNECLDDDDNDEMNTGDYYGTEDGELSDSEPVDWTQYGRSSAGSRKDRARTNEDRLSFDETADAEGSRQALLGSLQGRTFTMLESTAFYTAYVHTLQSLKALHSRIASRQSSLPFRSQFLELSRKKSAPRYHEASSGIVSFLSMMKYAMKLPQVYISATSCKNTELDTEKSKPGMVAASSSSKAQESIQHAVKFKQQNVVTDNTSAFKTGTESIEGKGQHASKNTAVHVRPKTEAVPASAFATDDVACETNTLFTSLMEALTDIKVNRAVKNSHASSIQSNRSHKAKSSTAEDALDKTSADNDASASDNRAPEHLEQNTINQLTSGEGNLNQSQDIAGMNGVFFHRVREEKERKNLLQDRYRYNQLERPQTWPNAEELGFDDSQYDALRLVLSHEVALIQGPPGTGKTTLGIRIAELLLRNEHLWRRDDNELMDTTPLLILSYTNHALDQFLTELLKLPVLKWDPVDSVVRVGSRSEHDVLKQHTINNMRRTIFRQGADALMNERRILGELRMSRASLDEQIQGYKDGIVHHEHFQQRDVISDQHLKSLVRRKPRLLPVILEWLCFDKEDFGRSLDQNVSYVHGNQNEKIKTNNRDQARHMHQKTPTQDRHQHIPASSLTVDKTETSCCGKKKAINQMEEVEEGQVMDASDDDEGQVHDTNNSDILTAITNGDDNELDPYEREMDLEEEHNRKLDLDDLSDDETGSSSHQDEMSSMSCEDDVSSLGDNEEATSDFGGNVASSSPMAIRKVQEFGEVTWQFPQEMVQCFSAQHLENSVSKILYEMNHGDFMTDTEEREIRDLWRLDITQRWRLYRLWLRRILMEIEERRASEEVDFKRVSKRVEELRSMTDLRIMKKARVVAMTTTGAARCAAILRELGPRVVLVEEAAQVSEAHLLSSLSPRCQHLIMIGDHQQLRPSYTNYDLTVRHHQHHIDISLFERLCSGGVPFKRLTLQHRMRPEISSLLVPTIYPDLKDHPSVLCYPNVEGVKVNVYFLNHSEPEDAQEESRSKRNTYEAAFLESLYLYLRLQGYTEKDITILALYKDQVLELRNRIKKVEMDRRLPQPPEELLCDDVMFGRGRAKPQLPKRTGARVTAVDNFQGEESRIVLLSLVRSNKEGKIGYLKEDNRVCVALSRAKEGLFVIGNCTMLSEKSPRCWKPILERARKSGSLGNAMPLYCRRHNHVTSVACHTDIERLCPNGGCAKSCDFRRLCGHTCERVCHDPKFYHKDPCTKPCVRKCPSGHGCKSECGRIPCPPCKEECDKLCEFGHPCSKTCGEFCAPCQHRCERMLSCGHRCQARCGNLCTRDCQELVKVQGACGHEFQAPCYLKNTAECTVPCTALLQCEHKCSGKCGSCFAGRLHVPCAHRCQRVLVCGHECSAQCTQSCPPCKRECKAQCPHSQQSCRKLCGEQCQRCIEPCLWRCKKNCRNKFRCRKQCCEMCDRQRCDEPCRSRHRCQNKACRRSYKCRGLFCERKCPRACPTCDKDIFDIFFGTEDDTDARFYKMPDCPCVLEVSGLDQYMDMDNDSVDHKLCPRCKSPVLTALRYSNVLKKADEDMQRVKAKLLTDPEELRTELRRKIIDRINDDTYWKINKSIQAARTQQQLTICENQINFISAIKKLRKRLPSNGGSEKLELTDKMARYLDSLTTWTFLRRTTFSQQQLTEFQTEMVRADLAVTFCIAASRLASGAVPGDDISKTVQTCIHRLIYKKEVLSSEEEADMRRSINDIRGRFSLGLGVSDEERVMIVKAMGFQKGHWYKCKNGHIYAIGECGGAMQESQCPECGGRVGGTQHRLTEGNAVATEMDGARFAAWSEQANLANYENLH